MTAVPVPAAAAALGVPVGTLGRWMRQGCPVARRGRRGRGCATLVDVQAVAEWRVAVERADTGRAALLVQLRAEAPGMVADAALAALQEAGLHVAGGAELRRTREAVGNTARRVAVALQAWAENQTRATDFSD